MAYACIKGHISNQSKNHIPLPINEDITSMQTVSVKNNRSIPISTRDKPRQESAHHSQRGKLFLAVINTVDCIWLVVQAVIVTL